MTTSGDFVAMQDVISALTNDADSLSPEECMSAIHDLELLKAATAGAISMVEATLRRHLEAGGPRQWGGKAYVLKDDGKWRDDHAKVRQLIVEEACRPDDDGVLPTTRDAAMTAARMVFDTYASDSTKVKQGMLDHFGLDRPQIASWKKSGNPKIVVVEVDAPEGAT